MIDDGAGSFPRRRCTASGICCSQVRAGRSISERSAPAPSAAVISASRRTSMTVPGIWTLLPSSMIRNMHQVTSWRIGPGRALTSTTSRDLPPSAKPPR